MFVLKTLVLTDARFASKLNRILLGFAVMIASAAVINIARYIDARKCSHHLTCCFFKSTAQNATPLDAFLFRRANRAACTAVAGIRKPVDFTPVRFVLVTIQKIGFAHRTCFHVGCGEFDARRATSYFAFFARLSAFSFGTFLPWRTRVATNPAIFGICLQSGFAPVFDIMIAVPVIRHTLFAGI